MTKMRLSTKTVSSVNDILEVGQEISDAASNLGGTSASKLPASSILNSFSFVAMPIIMYTSLRDAHSYARWETKRNIDGNLVKSRSLVKAGFSIIVAGFALSSLIFGCIILSPVATPIYIAWAGVQLFQSSISIVKNISALNEFKKQLSEKAKLGPLSAHDEAKLARYEALVAKSRFDIAMATAILLFTIAWLITPLGVVASIGVCLLTLAWFIGRRYFSNKSNECQELATNIALENKNPVFGRSAEDLNSEIAGQIEMKEFSPVKQAVDVSSEPESAPAVVVVENTEPEAAVVAIENTEAQPQPKPLFTETFFSAKKIEPMELSKECNLKLSYARARDSLFASLGVVPDVRPVDFQSGVAVSAA